MLTGETSELTTRPTGWIAMKCEIDILGYPPQHASNSKLK